MTTKTWPSSLDAHIEMNFEFRYNHGAGLAFHDGLNPALADIITTREMFHLAQDWGCQKYAQIKKYIKGYDSFSLLMHPDSSVKMFVKSLTVSYTTMNTERILFFYDSKGVNDGVAMLWLPGHNSPAPMSPARFSTHAETVNGLGDRGYYRQYEEGFKQNPIAMAKHMVCEIIRIKQVHRCAPGSMAGSNEQDFRLMPLELFVGSKELIRDVWDSLVGYSPRPVEMKEEGSAICTNGLKFGDYMEECGDMMITHYNNHILESFADNLRINGINMFPIVSGHSNKGIVTHPV